MSQLVTIAGTVSGVRVDSSITVNTSTNVTVHDGSMPNQASTSSQTVKKETTIFRVDNKPAYMNVAINITNGDIVTAAGVDKGEFEVVAVNNHTTRTMYWAPKPSIVPEIIYMVVGVFTLGFYYIGWFLIGGAVLFMMGKKKEIKMIEDACGMVQKNQPPAGK